MSADTKRPSRTGTIILGLLVVVMASGFGFFAFKYFQEKGKTEEQAVNIDELNTEIDDLEVELENYQLELDNANLEIEDKERMLAEKEQLLIEKQKRIDQLLSAGKISKQQAADLSKKVEQLEFYIAKYQKEIAELKTQVTALTGTNDSLLSTIDTITGKMRDLKDKNTEIALTLSAASVLKASNFKYFRVKSSGKEVNVTDEPLKKGAIEQLKVCFDVMANPAAKAGPRDVYISFYDPKGTVIKDMGGQSGYFTYEGKEQVYTMKTAIDYDKSDKKICMIFKQPSSYSYEKGVHTVRVYCENFEIAKSTFEVK